MTVWRDGDIVLAIENSNPGVARGKATAPERNPTPRALDADPTPERAGIAVGTWSAAAQRAELLAHEPIRTLERNEDDLVAAIARCMERAQRRPGDLRAVAVSIGPGGYTALRMSVAAAKMIALSSRARARAVPSAAAAFLAYSRTSESRRAPGHTAIVLASKAAAAYVEVYAAPDPAGAAATAAPRVVAAGRVMDSSEFAALDFATVLLDQHAPAEFLAVAAARSATLGPVTLDARDVLALAPRAPEVNANDLAPFYAREPEAVTLWRKLSAARPA
ncbi:hypothetical protein BH11PLA1_BH11PLA1_20450 [soil metagenome]